MLIEKMNVKILNDLCKNCKHLELVRNGESGLYTIYDLVCKYYDSCEEIYETSLHKYKEDIDELIAKYNSSNNST